MVRAMHQGEAEIRLDGPRRHAEAFRDLFARASSHGNPIKYFAGSTWKLLHCGQQRLDIRPRLRLRRRIGLIVRDIEQRIDFGGTDPLIVGAALIMCDVDGGPKNIIRRAADFVGLANPI